MRQKREERNNSGKKRLKKNKAKKKVKKSIKINNCPWQNNLEALK